MRLPSSATTSLAVLLLGATAWAQAPSTYQLPPQAIVDILDAPPAPDAMISPSRDVVAVLERTSMPTVAELAAPMLRLAGERINPRTNGPHRYPFLKSISLKVVADGIARRVTMPPAPRLAWVGFSPDGRRFAFTHTRDTGIELWVGETATGTAKALTTAQLNASLGVPCEWVGTGTALVCHFVVPSRGTPPSTPTVPTGPNIQESRGRKAPVRTYQDLLSSTHGEALFEYYATSQLAFVDVATGQRTPVGRPAIYTNTSASPDGNYLLVAAVKRPFSWLEAYNNFPKTVEVWDRRGAVVKAIADLPLADTVPNNGVLPGPRAWQWQALQPATVTWVEALDGGDPKTNVPHRDKIVSLAAPFSGQPSELARTEYRYSGLAWTEGGVALVSEFDRTKRWTRTWLIDTPGAAPRKLWDRSQEDAYGNPGTPLRRLRASNASAIVQSGDDIYLNGQGAAPTGARPFLDRLNVKTLESTRIFQTAEGSYEPVLGVLADNASLVLTRFESKVDPPNIVVRDVAQNAKQALTTHADPAPSLKGIQKQLVTYKRKDGVTLSATMITPPGWTPAQGRLPVLLWAYPREFVDPNAASQVTGSQDRFLSISGPSHLLFLTQGYAIIDDPTMPIVGAGETANDTYVDQLVASAQAAVDKAVEMGIADRDRLVAGGHSYGAFMTANLLAHSDIFRAGIARSGAYNRTLTPFGFQNEQRTFWEVPDLYAKMSPFWYADKINEPILLTHGEADDNTGTFPIQSERFYMALKGHGATVRYVTLPHEAHGYAGRESVLHTIAEMLNWANEWTKNGKATQ